jgi:hypothetical protein
MTIIIFGRMGATTSKEIPCLSNPISANRVLSDKLIKIPINKAIIKAVSHRCPVLLLTSDSVIDMRLLLME